MASAIKLYLDEHVDPDVAKGLRRHEVDVLTTQEAGKVHADDDVQLAFAISEGRAIFTQDTDFLRMASTTTTHFGIIFAPQGTPIGIIINDLCLIVGAVDQEELIIRSPWFLPLP
jgi:hypothetical protein